MGHKGYTTGALHRLVLKAIHSPRHAGEHVYDTDSLWTLQEWEATLGCVSLAP
jgi:hypothetical protein